MPQDPHRRRQPASVLRQVLPQRQVHPGGHVGQHAQAVGLLKGEVSEDICRPQVRKNYTFLEFHYLVVTLYFIQRPRISVILDD